MKHLYIHTYNYELLIKQVQQYKYLLKYSYVNAKEWIKTVHLQTSVTGKQNCMLSIFIYGIAWNGILPGDGNGNGSPFVLWNTA